MQYYFCLTSQIHAAILLVIPLTAVIAILDANLDSMILQNTVSLEANHFLEQD
jgi:hypothetical protein